MTERHSRAWWAEAVVRWQDSGQTAAEFAAREGVAERTLLWWSGALKRGTRAKRGSKVVRPIEIEVPRSSGHTIEIVLDDMLVRIGVGTDVGYVAELVKRLAARS